MGRDTRRFVQNTGTSCRFNREKIDLLGAKGGFFKVRVSGLSRVMASESRHYLFASFSSPDAARTYDFSARLCEFIDGEQEINNRRKE